MTTITVLSACVLAATFAVDAFADRPPDTIFELRQYTLHPGQRDTLVDVFDDRFVEGQEAEGIRVVGQYRDLDDPDRFVWLRGFPGMEARKDALTRFYTGPVWKAHASLANGTMIDSDNVLLLRPLRSDTAFAPSMVKLPLPGARGAGNGLLLASIVYLEKNGPVAFGEFFDKEMRPWWEQAGASVIAQMVSERGANTYSALPVRERDNVFVWFALFADQAALDKHQHALMQSMQWREAAGKLSAWTYHRIETLHLQPTARSRLQRS